MLEANDKGVEGTRIGRGVILFSRPEGLGRVVNSLTPSEVLGRAPAENGV